MRRRTLLQAAPTALLAAPWSGARAEAGVSNTDIVLGQTGILSGPLGASVNTLLDGARLAFAAVNAQGGVHGRQIQLVSMDDEFKPDKAKTNYLTMLHEQSVLAFFGCIGSGPTAAAAPLLKSSGAPLVGPWGVTDSVREQVGDSSYFVRASAAREAQAVIQHLATIGMRRVAMAHLDSPEPLALVRQAATVQGGVEIVAAGPVKGDGSNVAELAKTFVASNPQVVLLCLAGPLGGLLMKAVHDLGGNPVFYGMSILPGDVTARVVGERARGLAISQVIPFPWADADVTTREYRRLAEAKKVPVGYTSFEGYINAQVMIEALRRTGRELTRPRLHASLRSLKMRVATMDVDFTSGSNTGSRFIEMVQVTREGRFLR